MNPKVIRVEANRNQVQRIREDKNSENHRETYFNHFSSNQICTLYFKCCNSNFLVKSDNDFITKIYNKIFDVR